MLTKTGRKRHCRESQNRGERRGFGEVLLQTTDTAPGAEQAKWRWTVGELNHSRRHLGHSDPSLEFPRSSGSSGTMASGSSQRWNKEMQREQTPGLQRNPLEIAGRENSCAVTHTFTGCLVSWHC